jgi:hypothetical protein
MAVTLTTSQAAAAAAPIAEPTILIDLVTASAEVYHFATQPCCYGGVQYAARITDVSQDQGGAAGVPYQLAATKSGYVDLADDDGFFSTTRPAWLRGQPLTYKEVFLDVDTPVRQFAFTVTNQSLSDENTYRVSFEDTLASVRRKLIPSNDCLITDSLYPNLNRGVFQTGADGRNRPVPLPFGRAFTPLYYVDQASDGSHVYVAGVGSAYFTDSGVVCDWWDGGLSVLGGVTSASNDGHSTFPWSVRYAVRNTTREDGSLFSVPVTEVVVHPQLGPGDPIVRRFADLTWNHGSSAWATPDEVLIELFRNCHAAAGISPTLLNSDSLLTAHSFYTANSLYFDGALIEQRFFEDWLTQWQHDAMTRLVFRDQIHLVPCQSHTATFSLCDANILNSRVTYNDVPLPQEFSRRTLYYKDRTRDADYGPGDGSQGDGRGGSLVRFDVGSGAEVAMSSPFIGRPSVARRVEQFWAYQQATAQRVYEIPTTVKNIAVEEGDLGTLASSKAGVAGQLLTVYGATRRGGIYTLSLAETDITVYSTAPAAADPTFLQTYQRVPYSGDSYALTGGTIAVFTSSHQMGATPSHVLLFGLPTVLPFLTYSLVAGATTNNSQFTIAMGLTFATPLVGFNLQTVLGGWSLYA